MATKSSAARGRPSPEPAEDRDLGVLNDVLGFRLRRIQNHLAKTFAERLAGRDLKAGEFSALALISANPGISQTALAEEGGFDKTSLVVLIDDLERWGWAVRRRDTADRRRHALHITPAGQAMLKELVEIAHETEAPIAQALGQAERRALLESLDRIYRLCFSNDPL